MTAFVRPAGPGDIDAICTLLHTEMNDRIPLERWRRLMTYDWITDIPDFGRVVENNGRVLGYCGMVYADRIVGNSSEDRRIERIVSMSSWYLDKSLRGQGLGRDMLASATADRSLSYATLTNSRKPLGIVEAVGFRILEDHRYLWRRAAGTVDSSLIVTRDPAVIRKRVDISERKLIDDMARLPVAPILLEVGGRQTLLYFSVKRKDADITWHDLLYAGDRTLFVRHAQHLANVLLPDPVSVLAADGRFVQHAPDGAEREALPVPRYFKSERVAASEVDHLYSELQLLDLKLD